MKARSLAKVERLLQQLLQLIESGEPILARKAPSRSEWSVGEHVDHMIKVLKKVLEELLKRNQISPTKVTLPRFVVMTFGRIPRGRAKSPKMVLPVACSPTVLTQAVAEVRDLLGSLASEPNQLHSTTPAFAHPMLGAMTPLQTVRFLEIHTLHHLRIVRDILRHS